MTRCRFTLPNHVTAPILAAILAVGALITTSPPRDATAIESPGPGDANPALYSAVRPDLRAEISQQTAGHLSRYRIDAQIASAEIPEIAGTVDLRYVNDTGHELTELYLRLYANDPIYGPGNLTLGDVSVDGDHVPAELQVEETVARLPLASPLAQDATLDLSIPFTTTVPEGGGGYGMFGYEEDAGTWALAHWYPILAGYGPDGVWNLDPPSRNGDPIFSDTALFEVAITAPSNLRIVTTGQEVDSSDGPSGMTRHDFVSGPVRDFSMVVDNDFDVLEQEIDGTVVRSWYNPEDEDGAQKVLTYGVQSLKVYSDLFGPYPYAEMDLVEVAVGGGAAGIEFPQLMFIGSSYYDNPQIEQSIPGFFEFLVVHEVGHQWWYGLVGNDQYLHAFMDEGLTNYVSTIYFEKQHGEDQGRFQADLNLRLPYLTALFDGGDDVVDQPTDDFSDMGTYGVMIYSKGALGFDAVRRTIGDEAFFSALRSYAASERFQVATPQDLLDAFENASGQDLDGLWHHWFDEAAGIQDFTVQDLNDILREVEG